MKILIGSNNKWKIKDWKEKLKEFDLVSPSEVGINLEVEEGIISLKENALKKAREFSIKSGMITLSEDTGFFIDDLNGEPGVAFKRWAGELKEDASDEEFINHLKKKTSSLINPKGYFETVIAVVFPDGKEKIISIKIFGYISTKRLSKLKEINGFSLSSIFINEKSGKTWEEMNEEEQEELYKEMYENVKQILSKV